MLTQKRPQNDSSEQAADGNEKQRMAKVTMELDVQQRVVGRTNQNVGIGEQTRSEARHSSYARVSLF